MAGRGPLPVRPGHLAGGALLITLGAALIAGAVAGAMLLIVARSRSREWNAEGSDDARRASLPVPGEERDDGQD